MNLAFPIFFAVCSMLMFGLADFIAKAILTRSGTYRALLVSVSVGSVPFLAVGISFSNGLPNLSILVMSFISGVMFAASMFTFYSALRVGKATIVAPIVGCISAVAIVLSTLVLDERLTVEQIFLVVVIFCGILLLAIGKEGESSISFKSSKLSIVLALATVLIGGVNVILEKWIAVGGNFLPSFAIMRVSAVLFVAMLFPFFNETSTHETKRSYLAMALLGLIDASALFALFWALKTGLVSIVSPITNSSPITTIILARIFLHERVQFYQKLGIITVITCIMILSYIG